MESSSSSSSHGGGGGGGNDTAAEKPVMVVGVDESSHSFYALEWTLDRFFVPFNPSPPYDLVIVHARPSASSVLGIAGNSAANVTPIVDADLKRIADRVVENGKDLCSRKSVNNVTVDVMEGDARSVMCEAADKHRAAILVVGSHSYGPIKRAVLGSVSDFCAHHAHCSVLIVKKPKSKPSH